MNKVLQLIEQYQIIPVVVIDDADDAPKLADALVAGGLPLAEVTLRTDAAEEAIKKMALCDDICVGAGTVLTVEQAKLAIGAGAKYIVTPGTNPKVVEYCLSQNVMITPGVATPTDIELALGLGVSLLKFFPAEAMGGVKTLKAIGGPYKQVQFIPTGGISTDNLADYLALPMVAACGGSWMVKADMIKAGRFEDIKRLTEQAMAMVVR